ncbi:hypothetical protein, partial [Hungatella sp.]|uniref:hypothetical protein n=1 Tax=Hungatella sp. TaxID=2613924 RepID=UPI002A7ED653
ESLLFAGHFCIYFYRAKARSFLSAEFADKKMHCGVAGGHGRAYSSLGTFAFIFIGREPGTGETL